ncbi:Tht1-like nuclear fusion protein-domain-containing protein [Lipomyces japonicus]|uniref:Tht1-like nuclear fusion protein-domain-containing protein n=1 Tax=Lipomyces japonicus TaxID=56871 RepID=UPI0034CD0CA9
MRLAHGLVVLLWHPIIALHVFGSRNTFARTADSLAELLQNDNSALEGPVFSFMKQYSPCFLHDYSTDSSMTEIYNKLCELSPPSSCFRDSLADILPSCQILTTDMRVTHAIRLTLCELSAGLVDAPTTCLRDLTQKNQRENCLHVLKSSPQYWTSFSGNFRSIGSICFAERNTHEQEEIVLLYSNLTQVQHEALNILRHQMDHIKIENQNLMHLVHKWESYFADLDMRLGMLSNAMDNSSREIKTEARRQHEVLSEIQRENFQLVSSLHDMLPEIFTTVKDEFEQIFYFSSILKKSMQESVHDIDRACTSLDEFFNNSLFKYASLEQMLSGILTNVTSIIITSSQMISQQSELTEMLQDSQKIANSLINDQYGLQQHVKQSDNMVSQHAVLISNMMNDIGENLLKIGEISDSSTRSVQQASESVDNLLRKMTALFSIFNIAVVFKLIYIVVLLVSLWRENYVIAIVTTVLAFLQLGFDQVFRQLYIICFLIGVPIMCLIFYRLALQSLKRERKGFIIRQGHILLDQQHHGLPNAPSHYNHPTWTKNAAWKSRKIILPMT